STLGAGFFSSQTSQPVFDVIGPAVEEALRVTRNGKIGVIGTRATVLSGVYEQQLKEKTGIEVYSAACPLFVSLVEEGWLDRPETESIARHYLKPLLEKNIDTLILGCTHYPLLAPVIQKIVGDAAVLVDSAVSTAARVKKYLVEQQPDMPKNKPAHRFCLTDFAPHYDMIASSWLNIPVAFERIELSEAIRLV
ncbi:MAG: aspartate/glutamate racemase family protein, partial [bacterium]|nr:aspartate/glutamate racemase family protein [bacterium]